MSSSGALLSVARSAVIAHQHAVQVASQNVANVATPGYSRQRAELVAGTPVHTPQGVFGTGVFLSGVERARDELLDAGYRRDASRAAGSAMRRDLLGSVEAVFNEPSESGLAATLDAFWSSWGDLANAPNSAAARTVVRQRAGQLTDQLNTMSAQVDTAEGDARARLDQSLSDLNSYSDQIADLNERIVAFEVGGEKANDLRDARDRIVDQMAQLGPVRVMEARDGSATVLLGTTTLVDTNFARHLVARRDGAHTLLTVDGSDRKLAQTDGALGAMLDAVNSDIPATRGRLDAIAAALVDGVNGVHTAGYNGGVTGVPFFDPSAARRTAGQISLSSAVAASASAIATGYTATGSGDNKLALDVAAIREKTGMVGGQSIGAAYRDAVSSVATSLNAADRDATAGETLAQQADTRRQSVSGVSTDEELIALMRHQQAYTAATRLIKVADEMMQELLSLKR
jgi:flagellar hook-associated protein 1 FlgK